MFKLKKNKLGDSKISRASVAETTVGTGQPQLAPLTCARFVSSMVYIMLCFVNKALLEIAQVNKS